MMKRFEYDYFAGFGNEMRHRLMDNLAKDGQRILQECLAEKEYKNRSGALVSSYAWAVYYHGRVQLWDYSPDMQTYLKKYKGKYYSGSDVITDLIEEGGFKFPASSASMGLIIIAAMPYGEFLESGVNFAHKKFKVVSMSYDKLKQLSAKYGNASIRTILHGKMQ